MGGGTLGGREGGRQAGRQGGTEGKTERRRDWGRAGGSRGQREEGREEKRSSASGSSGTPALRENGQRPARAEGWAHSRRRAGRPAGHSFAPVPWPREGVGGFLRDKRPGLGLPSGFHPRGSQTAHPQAEPCNAARGRQPRPRRSHTQDDGGVILVSAWLCPLQGGLLPTSLRPPKGWPC